MLCRSITTEFVGPASTFAPRNCLCGPANCKHHMSTHPTATWRRHDIPEEQLAELKRLFDSQGPDDNSRCIPRRIQYCDGKTVSPCYPKLEPCAYPSSSSAMLCCCPDAICTIFLSSKPLTGTVKRHELPVSCPTSGEDSSLGSLSMSKPVLFPVAMCSPVRPLPS
jgi:hypothetical protein